MFLKCKCITAKNKRQLIHKSVILIGGLWTLKLRLSQRKLYRLVVVAECDLLFGLQWVYSQILRVGKLLFAAWKETGCAYLWMKGLARTLHPNKDHDPIWLPRHMVFVSQAAWERGWLPPRSDWINGSCMKADRVQSHEHTHGFTWRNAEKA